MAFCQGCGRIMVWGQMVDGKKIPLDPKAPVYKIVEQEGDKVVVERYLNAMVNHNSTCPAINNAAWKRKAETDRTEPVG
jgi:hypothetical protein